MLDLARSWRRKPLGLMGLALLLAATGCGDSSPPTAPAAGSVNPLASDSTWKQEIFENAVDNLHQLDEFQPQQMLERVIEQLNQSVDWKREVDWQPDPMLAALPETVRQMQLMTLLEDARLTRLDAFHLQETVTLQDVSRLAIHGVTDDLERAARLFDWTIRNVQLAAAGELGSDAAGQAVRSNHLPYETLFFGRGDIMDRAWLFVLLCRQQGLDAAVLAIPGVEGQPARPWAVGVAIDKKLYLFDPGLGLPIAKADGTVATLEEVAADDSILRRFDLDAEHPYPVTAADVSTLIALVDASPGYLSRRMMVLETKLTGDRKVVLTTRPSEVAEQIQSCGHIGDARLWGVPFERLVQRGSPEAAEAFAREFLPYRIDVLPPALRPVAASLQRGRVLHLKGRLAAEEEEDSANKFYQQARLADTEIHAAGLNDAQRLVLQRAKDDASFWLGLVAYERGRFETAADHFQKRTLDEQPRGGRWSAGARYNLGRSLEALEKPAEAAAAFEAANDDAQRMGNLLRAKRLRDGTAQAEAADEKPAEPTAAPESPEEADDTAAEAVTGG